MRLPLHVVLLVTVLGCAAPARAQNLEDRFWSETHVFRHIVSARKPKVTPLQAWNQLTEVPEKTVLIVLGRTAQNGHVFDRIHGGLTDFITAGGAVLIATDLPFTDFHLKDLCGGCYVDGKKLAAWPGRQRDDQVIPEQFIYRDQPQCLIPKPLNNHKPPLFIDNPLHLRRAELRVATNNPSWIVRAPFLQMRGTNVLAEFPKGCHIRQGGGAMKSNESHIFAVAAERDKGRFLMLADHGCFANDMIFEGLREQDNDNFLFAFNVVDWLRGKDNERDRVLFVQDTEIITDLTPKLSESEDAIRDLLREATRQINGVLLDVQDEHRRTNYLNQTLSQNVNYLLVVVVALAALLVLYGLVRIGRAAYLTDAAPLFAAVASRHRPANSTLAMRAHEAILDDDLREFGREAVRDWFAAFPGCPELGGPPPKVEARSGSVRREVLDLWTLAGGDDRPMKQEQFVRLLDRLDALSELRDRGELILTW